MACLHIRKLDGTIRTYECELGVSVPLELGETVVRASALCTDAPRTINAPTVQLKSELKDNGIQWGDAIAWATGKVGLTKCSACRARQELLNQIKKNGLAYTLSAIKDTFTK